jgi:predicted RNA binding protein YcfA (HicA-like mRNA interferase family)
MRQGDRTVRIPNPHRGDVGISLLSEILKQAGISDDEWNTA